MILNTNIPIFEPEQLAELVKQDRLDEVLETWKKEEKEETKIALYNINISEQTIYK